VERADFLDEDFIDRNNDIRAERLRAFETVGSIQVNRVFLQRRSIGAYFWHNDHVCGILNEKPCIPVVRVVIVGTMGDYHVGFPFPYKPDEMETYLQSGHNLAVRIVEDLRCDAEDGICGGGFRLPYPGHLFSRVILMPGVAVGDRNEFYPMSCPNPFDRGSTNLEFAVVRVRSENDDVHGFSFFY
jgi:hypothetical protein